MSNQDWKISYNKFSCTYVYVKGFKNSKLVLTSVIRVNYFEKFGNLRLILVTSLLQQVLVCRGKCLKL